MAAVTAAACRAAPAGVATSAAKRAAAPLAAVRVSRAAAARAAAPRGLTVVQAVAAPPAPSTAAARPASLAKESDKSLQKPTAVRGHAAHPASPAPDCLPPRASSPDIEIALT